MSDLNLEDKLCKNLEDSCIKAYNAGQQSMQAKIDELQNRVDEISGYATELAEYASYAEIIGSVSHNRHAIRQYCDKIFAYNRAIDLEEEKALRGAND